MQQVPLHFVNNTKLVGPIHMLPNVATPLGIAEPSSCELIMLLLRRI